MAHGSGSDGWDDSDFVDEPAPDETDVDVWDPARHRPPLPADGIRARTRRGAIGESWWSRRFLDALEGSGGSGRLSRGRSYARKGQVLHIDIGPGEISARVQGSRPEPYDVSVRVRTATEAQWSAVEDGLASRAEFAAAMLSGRLPGAVAEVFGANGVDLFPPAGAVGTSCTCPDWDTPCKHVAAVCYLVAESLDDDPFLLLAWLGRDRESLLAGLRRRRAGAAPVAAGSGGEEPAPPQDHVEADPARFWSAGAALEGVRAVPRAGRVADVALARLGPLPLRVGPLDVEDVLRLMYLRFTRAIEERALGG